MSAESYDLLASALEQHRHLASEEVVAEARSERDRLHKKRKKHSQKLRRAHADAMAALPKLQDASDATTLQAQLDEAMQHAGVLPTLDEEIDAAQGRLEALSTEASAAAEQHHGDAPSEAVHLPSPSETAPVRATASALSLQEIAAATADFAQDKLIGSGGYGRVYFGEALPSVPPESLPLRLRGAPVAVKRAKSGAHDLADLQREVSVLQACDHPHVLPLLGFYLENEAPCLVFPLMRGGSLADRLWPRDADSARLQRLGLSPWLEPLGWRHRLTILCQATDALLYLHTPVPGGKGCVVHRDFKPENILLDSELNACLADTGFAKMEQPDGASAAKSASNALYLTKGYLDPSVVQGGEYSAATDGYALGITILVTLTRRSPLTIIHCIEEEQEEDFGDIDADRVADALAAWPSPVASALKELVLSSKSKCLCHQSQRKRLPVAEVLEVLQTLQSTVVQGGDINKGAASGLQIRDAEQAGQAEDAGGYAPTPLSMQVRALRKGGDTEQSVKDNMLLAFGKLMSRLDAVYGADQAPDGFEERINFWHRERGMPSATKDDLHRLRVWANAARHGNDGRWRRDGPQSSHAASQLVASVEQAVVRFESACACVGLCGPTASCVAETGAGPVAPYSREKQKQCPCAE